MSQVSARGAHKRRDCKTFEALKNRAEERFREKHRRRNDFSPASVISVCPTPWTARAEGEVRTVEGVIRCR